jgi:Cu/Ag efflux pump CusA
LFIATGAGSASRQILGTVVIAGMLLATVLGIFLVPVLFVAIGRLTEPRRSTAPVLDQAAAAAGEQL